MKSICKVAMLPRGSFIVVAAWLLSCTDAASFVARLGAREAHGALRRTLVTDKNASVESSDLYESSLLWDYDVSDEEESSEDSEEDSSEAADDGHGHGHGDDGHGHDDHGHSADHGHAQEVHGAKGHGPASHGHGHVEVYDPVAGTIAVMLFGTVAWVISLFYFVNFPDEDIQKATWKTLSDMISIFCAVLLFSASTRTLQDFAGGFGLHHHGPPPTLHLIVSQIRFWVFFLLLQVVFYTCSKKPWIFKYITGVGCHVVGFGAIDAFGNMLHMEMFAASIGMSSLGVLLTAVFLVSIFSFTAKMRDRIAGSLAWRLESVEAESDACALALGLLVSMILRFAITGHLPPVHGAPRNKTTGQVWTLFTLSILQGPLVVAVSVLKHRLADMNIGSAMQELVETFHSTVKMSMGWSLLFWGYWCFYNRLGDQEMQGGKIGQRVTMAVVFSGIVFAAIIVIDRAADYVRDRSSDGRGIEHGLRALLATFGLLMGLAWEATFVQAVYAVSLKYDDEWQMYMVVGITTGLCVVVLPAWALYILPNSMENAEEFPKEFLAHETEERKDDEITPAMTD